MSTVTINWKQLLFETFPTLTGQRASDETVSASLERLERLAVWMDELFTIPLVGRSVGLEPLLAQIPFIGSAVPPLIGLYALLEACHAGAPPELVTRMIGRHALDFTVSRMPLIGAIFDAWYKAHRRNITELREHFHAELGARQPAAA